MDLQQSESQVDRYFEGGSGPAYEDAIMEVVLVHEAMQRADQDGGNRDSMDPIRGLSKAEAQRLLPVAVDLATYALGVLRGDIEASDG